jgi:hypothetical protein
VNNSREVAHLGWTFRPGQTRPADVLALAGSRIYGTGPVGGDGRSEIVLQDGTRVSATATEIVAEAADSGGTLS